MPRPHQPRIAVWINRDDYDAFKGLSPNDPDLPDAYDDWLKIATEQAAKLEASSIPVEKVIINPQQFAAYCRASGIDTNNVTRGGFAIVAYRCQKEGRAIPGTEG